MEILMKKTNNVLRSKQCNQCDYAPFHAGNFRTHLKTHSGEKSNKCNQCGYASSRADTFEGTFEGAQWRKVEQLQPM